MKRTHSKDKKYTPTPPNSYDEFKYDRTFEDRQTSIWPTAHFSDVIDEQSKRPQIQKDYFKREGEREAYRDFVREQEARKEHEQNKRTKQRETPWNPIVDFYSTNLTDLNSINTSPEVIYNPAGSMSYLNPQNPIMPRQVFSNTPYINAEPALNNPIYNRPSNPIIGEQRQGATAIKPVKTVVDGLIPSSMSDYINYDREFTRLQPNKPSLNLRDTEENKALTKDVENINFARKELDNMKSRTDSFFDGADLDRRTLDKDYNPQSVYEKMKGATSSHYDNYNGKVINPQSVVNDDDIAGSINGLNLAALPEGNELIGRTNNTYMDPYYTTNTNNLSGDLVSQLNFQNLLLGENSIYARPKDMDLLESGVESGYTRGDSGDPPGGGGGGSQTANGGRPFSSSINFKTLNKTQISKNYRGKSNKWIGTGQRTALKPTLSDVRSAKIPVRIPSMKYQGNQVNLVRRGNQTTDLINSEYEP